MFIFYKYRKNYFRKNRVFVQGYGFSRENLSLQTTRKKTRALSGDEAYSRLKA